MKYMASLITISRILLSMLLIPLINNFYPFTIVYILCGFSDVLDGFIARKTNTVSKLGAKIDSAADVIMFMIILVVLIRLQAANLSLFLPYIIIVLLIRSINVIFGVYKFKTLVMVHTLANKLTGLLLFIAPLTCVAFSDYKFLILVCVTSVISAIEEGAIIITSKEIDLNKKSIFIK